MNDSYLCIDIGTSSIKALEKDAAGNVLRWGLLERRGRPFHTTIQPLDETDAARHLMLLLKKMGATSDKAVASVPAFLALTTVAEAADPSFVPAAAGTFQLASIKLPDDRCFLYAAPNDVIEKYQRIFESAGLNLKKMELESVALANRLAGPELILIVDLGHRFTTFTVAENGKPVFISQTDFATASFDGVSASGVANVIMKKTEEISRRHSVKQVVFSGGQKGTFDVVLGLWL